MQLVFNLVPSTVISIRATVIQQSRSDYIPAIISTAIASICGVICCKDSSKSIFNLEDNNV